MSIHQRILLIIKEKGFSEQKDFCLAIGVKYPMFNAMMNNQSEIRHSVLAKILESYPDVNADWLLSGNGSLSKNFDQSKNNVINSGNGKGNTVTVATPEYELLQQIIMDKNKEIEYLRKLLEKKI